MTKLRAVFLDNGPMVIMKRNKEGFEMLVPDIGDKLPEDPEPGRLFMFNRTVSSELNGVCKTRSGKPIRVAHCRDLFMFMEGHWVLRGHWNSDKQEWDEQ